MWCLLYCKLKTDKPEELYIKFLRAHDTYEKAMEEALYLLNCDFTCKSPTVHLWKNEHYSLFMKGESTEVIFDVKTREEPYLDNNDYILWKYYGSKKHIVRLQKIVKPDKYTELILDEFEGNRLKKRVIYKVSNSQKPQHLSWSLVSDP